MQVENAWNIMGTNKRNSPVVANVKGTSRCEFAGKQKNHTFETLLDLLESSFVLKTE